jgi:hypothetical protein
MPRMLRALALTGICLALVLPAAAGSNNPVGIGAGKEWLGWTPSDRNSYIRGFIEGYWRGTKTTCLLADELFEVGKSQQLGRGPSARCQARLEGYTKIKTPESAPDFSAYTTVITEFYTKYPEHQDIPVVYIMRFLTDQNFKTADQIFQIEGKREVPTHF